MVNLIESGLIERVDYNAIFMLRLNNFQPTFVVKFIVLRFPHVREDENGHRYTKLNVNIQWINIRIKPITIQMVTHIIFYVPSARKLVFSLQLTVAQCSTFRQKGMKCKNWTAHAPVSMKRSSILLILLLLRTALASYWQSLVHLNCTCVY